MYDYQIASQVIEAHRQDLITEARVSRLRKAAQTARATRIPTRPGRRLIGRGFRRLSVA
jgi:hypothetical protein